VTTKKNRPVAASTKTSAKTAFVINVPMIALPLSVSRTPGLGRKDSSHVSFLQVL
jgi:hypothetical protein